MPAGILGKFDMWPVKHGQPYANEIERWMYANLVAAFFEKFDELRDIDVDDPFECIDATEQFDALPSDAKLANVSGRRWQRQGQARTVCKSFLGRPFGSFTVETAKPTG